MTPIRQLGLFLHLLTAVTTTTAQMTCSHSSNALPYLQFCTKINYDVLGPASQSAHVIDQIAKQTYVQSLHMHSSCGGKVLSKQCSIAFRQYSCAYHFPKCVNATATTATHLLPPCREVCEHYCSVCNMAGCPCFDLPIKAAEGAAPTCQSLEALCPAAQGVGKCAWDSVDMPDASGQGPVLPSRMLVLLSTAVVFFVTLF